MSAAFIGEIRLFAATFSPTQWAFCNGTIINVSSNESLFSLLGAAYGGDGRTSFGLPDMRGRVPMHFGNGPSLTPRPIGQRAGNETVHLTTETMPQHNHNLRASTLEADSDSPVGHLLAALPASTRRNLYLPSQEATSIAEMSQEAITSSGASKAHINMMPVMCVNFIIALTGDYPSRN
jgi:microcystin-dependent protein